ncbi:MAG TPA: cupredoxin domain-containing protein [Candidatus Baltobacteraceae bacterium]|nr:cupredoxin domain-containing protein [Candidatus Baltobacteraceae bacterium]
MRLFFTLALAAATIALGTAPAPAASEPVIKITAKNWAFAPATITLKLHQKTKLEFVAGEGIHGITIPDLGVDDVVNIQSTPTDVEVTPSKTGTYVAHCAVFCGAGHADMILTIKVVP